jgi:phosphomannomutase
MSSPSPKRLLLLFDVDGTLTEPRGDATDEIKSFLIGLKEKVTVGVVGGSDLAKQKEQLGANIVAQLNYSFPENGLVAFKDGTLFHEQSFKDYLGEDRLKQLINFLLHSIADIDIPVKVQVSFFLLIFLLFLFSSLIIILFFLFFLVPPVPHPKRGTFIEFRTGMINASPIGRNCSLAERKAFEIYDKEHHIREKLIKKLQEKFADVSGSPRRLSTTSFFLLLLLL